MLPGHSSVRSPQPPSVILNSDCTLDLPETPLNKIQAQGPPQTN